MRLKPPPTKLAGSLTLANSNLSLRGKPLRRPSRAYLAIGDIRASNDAIQITATNKGKTPAQNIIVRYSLDYSGDDHRQGRHDFGVIDTGLQIAPEKLFAGLKCDRIDGASKAFAIGRNKSRCRCPWLYSAFANTVSQ